MAQFSTRVTNVHLPAIQGTRVANTITQDVLGDLLSVEQHDHCWCLLDSSNTQSAGVPPVDDHLRQFCITEIQVDSADHSFTCVVGRSHVGRYCYDDITHTDLLDPGVGARVRLEWRGNHKNVLEGVRAQRVVEHLLRC